MSRVRDTDGTPGADDTASDDTASDDTASDDTAGSDDTASTHDEVERILADWRRQRPDLDPSPMGVFGRIARVAARSQADLTAVLGVYSLTPASFDVLANLRRSDPPHRKTPGELAASSMMSTGGMTFRVDKLEDAGLVVREPAPHDRRVVYVQLTDAGRTLMDEVIEVHLARKAELLADFDPEELATVASLLAKLDTGWPS